MQNQIDMTSCVENFDRGVALQIIISWDKTNVVCAKQCSVYVINHSSS